MTNTLISYLNVLLTQLLRGEIFLLLVLLQQVLRFNPLVSIFVGLLLDDCVCYVLLPEAVIAFRLYILKVALRSINWLKRIDTPTMLDVVQLLRPSDHRVGLASVPANDVADVKASTSMLIFDRVHFDVPIHLLFNLIKLLSPLIRCEAFRVVVI